MHDAASFCESFLARACAVSILLSTGAFVFSPSTNVSPVALVRARRQASLIVAPSRSCSCSAHLSRSANHQVAPATRTSTSAITTRQQLRTLPTTTFQIAALLKHRQYARRKRVSCVPD